MSTELNFINYKELAKNFKTEEDVRAETNMYLKILCEQFGISTKDSGHEITSYYGGRADSMYSDVIIEYKSPKVNLKTEKGFKEVVYGRDNKDHGLFHYLVNFSLQDSKNDNDLFIKSIKNKVGIGFNGKTFIFVRFVESTEETNLYDENKTKHFPKTICMLQKLVPQTEVIDDIDLGFRKLILYMRATTKKILSSKSILDLFGPDSELCNKSLVSIVNCLSNNIDNNNLRVITLYNEWNLRGCIRR